GGIRGRTGGGGQPYTGGLLCLAQRPHLGAAALHLIEHMRQLTQTPRADLSIADGLSLGMEQLLLVLTLAQKIVTLAVQLLAASRGSGLAAHHADERLRAFGTAHRPYHVAQAVAAIGAEVVAASLRLLGECDGAEDAIQVFA